MECIQWNISKDKLENTGDYSVKLFSFYYYHDRKKRCPLLAFKTPNNERFSHKNLKCELNIPLFGFATQDTPVFSVF